MSDEFLDRVSNFWRNRGLAYSPDALVQNFQLYGPAKRAAMLDEFDNALRDQGTVEFSEPAMRRAAEAADLRGRLDSVHQALIRSEK